MSRVNKIRVPSCKYQIKEQRAVCYVAVDNCRLNNSSNSK